VCVYGSIVQVLGYCVEPRYCYFMLQVVPPDIIDLLVTSIFADTHENIEKTVRDIISTGFSATQILSQVRYVFSTRGEKSEQFCQQHPYSIGFADSINIFPCQYLVA
jgi:hypothetical protein